MNATGPATARYLPEGRTAGEGDARRVRARDRVLGLPCVLRYAPAGSPAAARLLRDAERLIEVEHPWIAPLLGRFTDPEGTPSIAGAEPGSGYAVHDPPEPSLSDALAEATPEARVRGLAAALRVIEHLHARGVVHGRLGPESIRWRDGAPIVLWGEVGPPWPGTPEGPAADLHAIGCLARELLRGWTGPERQVLDLPARTGNAPSATDLLAELAALGVVVEPPANAVPDVPVAPLVEALEHVVRPVAFVGGPPGAGLAAARRVLSALGPSWPALDLSWAPAPLGALHRWLLAGDRPPTFDATWADAIRQALAEPRPAMALIAGDVSRWSDAERSALLPLLDAMSRAGIRVLVAASGPVAGTLTIPVHGVEPAAVSATAGAALRHLQGLPLGIPPRVVAALPVALRTALPDLAHSGHARFDDEGNLVVAGAGSMPLDPALAQALEPSLVDPIGESDPLWRAVVWIRAGRLDRAAPLLAEARRVATGREDLMVEAATPMAADGHPAARQFLAEVELARGQPHRALAALSGMPAREAATALLLGRALRLAGRLAEAMALLRPAAEEHDQGSLWCELARAFVAAGRSAEAAEALERAERSPRGPSRRALLAARSRLALASAGPKPEDVLGVLEALQRSEGAPPGLLARIARVLGRLGEGPRAADLLAVAISQAEASGGALLAAVLRVALARHARRAGRDQEAREALHEALLAARIGRWALLERVALARLVDLEAAAGRHDVARVHLHALGERLGASSDAERVEAALLGARVALASGDPGRALEALGPIDPATLSGEEGLRHALVRAQALLETGRVAEARHIAEATPIPPDARTARRLLALRGRIHLALGRRFLEEARQRLPADPHPGERVEVGEILLAWAGEDADADDPTARARGLERAAGLLTGASRVRAERLAARWPTPAPPAPVRPAPTVPAAPREVLGVLLGRPEEAKAIETAVALLDPARSNNLLLTGPTGAGKRVFAERLVRERLGLDGLEEVVLRRTDPQMLVSLLVGTRRGEFTGAVDQTGAIQRALQGRKALLLDELHTLDRVGQEILLPLLELPRRRFGGLMRSSHEIDRPLQIVLATNVDVSGSKWRDRFRSDLWFRMSQLHVHLPSLAERGPEATAEYFARMLAEEGFDDAEEVLEPRAIYALLAQPWEGNLRELHAAVRRVARFRRQQERRLTADDLPQLAVGAEVPSIAPFGSRDVLETLELNAVIEALRRCDWNQSAAAERLAISKYRLHRILHKHDLLDWVRDRRKTGNDPDLD